jgi:hypothetical protein
MYVSFVWKLKHVLWNTLCILMITKTKLRGFGPRANYTDRATAACWRSYCQILRTEGVAWSAQWIPTVVNHGFL